MAGNLGMAKKGQKVISGLTGDEKIFFHSPNRSDCCDSNAYKRLASGAFVRKKRYSLHSITLTDKELLVPSGFHIDDKGVRVQHFEPAEFKVTTEMGYIGAILNLANVDGDFRMERTLQLVDYCNIPLMKKIPAKKRNILYGKVTRVEYAARQDSPFEDRIAKILSMGYREFHRLGKPNTLSERVSFFT